MENFDLQNDIAVIAASADRFPEGIVNAHKKLIRLVKREGRIFFGLSRPEHGAIQYHAAASENHPAEAEGLDCRRMIIRKGIYSFENISGFQQHPQRIQQAFRKLLAHPKLDPEGYCVEWYLPEGTDGLSADTVRCMVRILE